MWLLPLDDAAVTVLQLVAQHLCHYKAFSALLLPLTFFPPPGMV